MIIAIILIVIVVIIVAVIAGMYNSLVKRRNQVDNAWSQIDVQLKRRHDLIPNLVEAVKDYMALRAGDAANGDAGEARRPWRPRRRARPRRRPAENGLTRRCARCSPWSRTTRTSRRTRTSLSLQEELTSTENKIAFARQFYNDSVMTYNTQIQSVPDQHHRRACSTSRSGSSSRATRPTARAGQGRPALVTVSGSAATPGRREAGPPGRENHVRADRPQQARLVAAHGRGGRRPAPPRFRHRSRCHGTPIRRPRPAGCLRRDRHRVEHRRLLRAAPAWSSP